MTKLKSLFQIDSTITFLNFGSFGACPKPIFDHYQRWQLELEREPVQFMIFKSPILMHDARKALANYLHADPSDLVYVTNPSYGVNIISKGLDLQPGDEVLSTDLEYGACDKAWEFACTKAGAKYIRQHISLPIANERHVVTDLFKGVTDKTKLIFVSHITSATALLLPVADIVQEAKRRGIMVFVDGAHGPGQVHVDLTSLDADMYVGACHKWMMAPKGSSFLHVKREHQRRFPPLTVSWGYDPNVPDDKVFVEWHQLQGTRDISAFLTVPEAIRFMHEHHWEKVSLHCKQLARDNARHFCDLVGTAPLAPLDGTFTGQMFSIPVNCMEPEKLQRHLFEDFKIEIPVMRQNDKVYVRYSINGFNDQEDIDKLYEALKVIRRKGELL